MATARQISIEEPFTSTTEAALALLSGGYRLTRKAGQFLGQLIVDPTPLTHAQSEWLATLLTRAKLPPLVQEGA